MCFESQQRRDTETIPTNIQLHTKQLAHTVSDAGLGDGSFKSSSNSGINTLGLAPGRPAEAGKVLVLVAFEALGALLNHLGLN